MLEFGRVLTAMVTPFDASGEIDFSLTEVLIEHLIANGTDTLVVAGTTGESPTLSTDEKIKLFKFVVDKVNKRVPIIAGTGSNNTKASIELTKKAEEIGVDGVMLVVPYYNKPNQQGIYEHFKAIAESTTLPVMLYNIPGRSVVNMAVETVVKLSHINNIFAVKEASGDLNAMTEILSNAKEGFVLYSGDDGITIPVLSIGGHGVVSVASHVIGNEMQTLVNLFLEGNNEDAAKLHQKLLPIMKGLFIAPNPVPVKAALQSIGVNAGTVRLPLVPLDETQQKFIENLLK
ncbi:MAG: dihydrodipicolinate synthase [Bacillales bacterium]|jgi:4-hydroxy-tetrahydrodipicolinate synthase|nr:dihydrodipicolinate synthase [Bacillales bacterium]